MRDIEIPVPLDELDARLLALDPDLAPLVAEIEEIFAELPASRRVPVRPRLRTRPARPAAVTPRFPEPPRLTGLPRRRVRATQRGPPRRERNRT